MSCIYVIGTTELIYARTRVGSKMLLEIELVPSPLWHKSLKDILSRSEWDKIRKEIYKKYRYKCGICGSEGKMICHNIFEYDDVKYIQKLTDFISLCFLCNCVKHLGWSAEHLSEEDYDKVIRHFMKVNNCGRETFDKCEEYAAKKWAERSAHTWTQDFGGYRELYKDKNQTDIIDSWG